MSSPVTFSRFVEVGRVVLVSKKNSSDDGKLATIVEIVDANRVRSDEKHPSELLLMLCDTLAGHH